MRTTLSRLALALILAFGLSAGAPARADDDAKPLSAAEQAYKDAWWAETGGGDLNAALALYEKAAAEEGPVGVRAKALYRRALIQQRIGKTQDAIQTLERLAKEHPGEAEVQADARARLAEWTAVDLRTGFPEWYRRFQYGPEFQAKILDLVLRLGGSTVVDVQAARQEILTIGEPALPALRAHLGTRNSSLASQVVDTLMQLGEVPDEVVGNYGMWTTSEGSWTLILDLPAERRGTLLARLDKALDAESPRTLGALLQGPMAGVEFLVGIAAPAPEQGVPPSRYLAMRACLARLETRGPQAERIRTLALSGALDPGLWYSLARWLLKQNLVTRADVDAWARLPSDTAAEMRAQALRDAKLFQPDEALKILGQIIETRRAPSQNWPRRRWLLEALDALLPSLPWPESRDEVARYLGALWQDEARWGPLAAPSDRLLDAFGRAFELARDPNLVNACADVWMQHGPGRPGGTETLFRWAREGASPVHRQRARSALFPRLGPDDIDKAIDLLVLPETVDDDVSIAWRQLLASGDSPETDLIFRSQPRLWRLLDRIARLPAEEGNRAVDLASWLRHPIMHERVVPMALLELWLDQPERFPTTLFWQSGADLVKVLSKAGQIPALRSAFRARWASANPAQRAGLVPGVVLLAASSDPATTAFLREILSAKPAQVPADWRGIVVNQLAEISLQDVAAFYDLTQSADVDEAASLIMRSAATPPVLAASAEAFTALRLAFRPDGNLAGSLTPYLAFEAIQRPLLEALLAHGDYNVRLEGARLLKERSSPDDAELWIKALKDPKAPIRATVAQELRRVPTPATLKALVTALDDPHPDVRAAALDSLDAIQKMEDLKARWREKVK